MLCPHELACCIRYGGRVTGIVDNQSDIPVCSSVFSCWRSHFVALLFPSFPNLLLEWQTPNHTVFFRFLALPVVSQCVLSFLHSFPNLSNQIIGVADTGLDVKHCFFLDSSYSGGAPFRSWAPSSSSSTKQASFDTKHRKVVQYVKYGESLSLCFSVSFTHTQNLRLAFCEASQWSVHSNSRCHFFLF